MFTDVDVERVGEVDGEHLHKAFGVDNALSVVHLHLEGLKRRQADEFFYVVEGKKAYKHLIPPIRDVLLV